MKRTSVYLRNKEKRTTIGLSDASKYIQSKILDRMTA